MGENGLISSSSNYLLSKKYKKYEIIAHMKAETMHLI